MYAEIFRGVTLTVTTGSGFPNLAAKGFTVPAESSAACPNPNMDCAAETTILVYFKKPSVGGSNAKAAQTDGMEASRVSLGRFNLGVDAIKLVSRSTAQFTSPGARILGGAQFNSSFANFTLTEGCTFLASRRRVLPRGVTLADLANFNTVKDVPKKDLISPEQAAYNVLRVFFDGTPVASFFGGTPGPTPTNYLQIYAADFLYADAHVHEPKQVVETGGASVSTSAQDLLNLASQKLLEIGEPSSSRR